MRQILTLMPLCIVIVSCSSHKHYQKNISNFETKVSHLSCLKLNDELSFINSHIEQLKDGPQNSAFDNFMEGLLSFGIYSGDAYVKRRSHENIFFRKKNIIIKQKEIKNCK